jgi:hypothetical protein
MYILTRPHSHSVEESDVETGPKLREDWSWQAFGEDVGELTRRRDVKDADSSKGHSFSNEVKINLNVLGTLMLNGVRRHVDGADVVTIDQGGLTDWSWLVLSVVCKGSIPSFFFFLIQWYTTLLRVREQNKQIRRSQSHIFYKSRKGYTKKSSEKYLSSY